MNILVPTDGSDLSQLALKRVVDFAKKDVDKIFLITVVPTTFGFEMDIPLSFQEKYTKQLKENAAKMLENIAKPLKDGNFNYVLDVVQSRTISDGIIDYASKNNIELIVMSSHGAKRANLLLGSVASDVVYNAKCSVYVVKQQF